MSNLLFEPFTLCDLHLKKRMRHGYPLTAPCVDYFYQGGLESYLDYSEHHAKVLEATA